MDVATGQWEAVGSMGTKRWWCAAVVQGRHVYAIGGRDGTNHLETVERMDVATGQWEAVGSMGTKRRGRDGTNYLETVERMDVATGQWEAVDSMGTKRSECAAVVQGRHVYAIGGYGGTNRLETVERMDVATGQWKAVGSMGTKRAGCAAVVQGRHIYAIGGHDGTNRLQSGGSAMGVATGQWEKRWATWARANNNGAGAVTSMQLGGYEGTNYLETVERMDVATGQWKAVGSMGMKRYGCAAVVQGQHIYAIGGLDGTNRLKTVERMDWQEAFSRAELVEAVTALSVLHCKFRAVYLQRSHTRAEMLLARLEGHVTGRARGARVSEVVRPLRECWASAQRAVREAVARVEPGAAQVSEELQRAVRSREEARERHIRSLEALLSRDSEQWAGGAGLCERRRVLQEEVDEWRTALDAAEASMGSSEGGSGVSVQNAAMDLQVTVEGAVAAYQAWDECVESAHRDTERAVATLRGQLQGLFQFADTDSADGSTDESSEMVDALQNAQAALEAERWAMHAKSATGPTPLHGLVAAGRAVLAEVKGEAEELEVLVGIQEEVEQLRRAQDAAREGRPGAAAAELRGTTRMLRRQRMSLSALRATLGQHKLDLEEQSEEPVGAGATTQRKRKRTESAVEEAEARVEAKVAEVRDAQDRMHVATCTLVALESQFPEVLSHMEHAVPAELLPLWRPERTREDFVEYAPHARQGVRHEVWRAKDTHGQQFAVKEFHIAHDDPGALRALWREASLLHRMRHPAITPVVALFPSVTAGTTTCYGLQMPWYEHGQLDEWKAAQQPDEGAVRRGMLRVLEAVAHLHGNNVVHCDIKPENILVDASGRPHLLDFDISVDNTRRTSVVYARQTTVQGARGTAGYIAPEMAATGPTPATDMFAFSVTLAAVSPPEGQRGAELQELLRVLSAEDPAVRPSAAQACQHPYFTGVWEWRREQSRVCCMDAERSVCGGAEHRLSGGVECTNRLGAPHFVCARCLAAHALRESERRDGRVGCPHVQDPTAECESCEYTDLELARHLRPAEYEHYMSGRRRRLQEAIEQEVQAQQAEALREEMERLRQCRICLTVEANALFMNCGHYGACLQCAQRLPAPPHCPFCREPVARVQQVFRQ
ncbi:hypothetical protein CYMTET_20630 [Cymbomonas tetramitiformis]|uniref:RING-type domain-containing protein n=1 Tax=Cymbomonas tetramitiformis TaxID=36881 RepID=A0AAE0G4Y3_9CHLO|nr:hypothetical protein CYMTET_20630 [Cymbomonas tetramitiformis]